MDAQSKSYPFACSFTFPSPLPTLRHPCRAHRAVHFVLELIQNADDNSYAPEVVPTLRVHASDHQIEFSNNEVGFSEGNILALCSMGESTKKASDAGYIGNKGIGFKSVFKITQTPRVHSRIYHLQFDSQSGGGLGYIVPIPVPPPDGWDSQRGTAIVLPLQPGASSDTLRDFRVHMSEIKPSLLLFLHRLSRIELHDAVGGVVRTLSRRPELGDPLVMVLEEAESRANATAADLPRQLQHAGRALSTSPSPETAVSRRSRWLVLRETLRTKVERLGIEQTEVALAFPLETDEGSPPPPLDVCAYLPLRTYGLRFLLQADFVVPSSRESVDSSSEWNQWLRDEVPALFLRATGEFLRRASAQVAEGEVEAAVDLLNRFFEFCPLPGSVMDFFAPLGPACCRLLRSSRCVLTREGELVLPVDAVTLAPSEAGLLADGIDPEALLRQLDLRVAHPRLRVSSALARELGVRSVDASLLCEALAQLSSRWGHSAEVDFRWLAWAMHELQRDPTLSTHLPALRRLPLIPLASGAMSSTEQGAIYEVPEPLAAELANIAPHLRVVRELRVVDPEFLRELARARTGVHVLLGRLRVVPLERETLVKQHLLPQLASAAPPSELPPLLALAVAQGASCAALGGGELERLLRRARVRLVCSHGGGVVALSSEEQEQTHVHLGARTRRSTLAEHEGDFVPEPSPAGYQEVDDDAYLSWRDDVASWQRLFSSLGLRSFPAVVALPAPDLGDWHSPALDALLESLCRDSHVVGAPVDRLTALLNALVDRWVRRDGRAWGLRERALVGQASPESLLISPDGARLTRLVATLRGAVWVPGTDGSLHRPADLWFRTPEIEGALSDAATFAVQTRVPMSLEMARVLGMRTELTPQRVLDLLHAWSGAHFEATLVQMAHLLRAVCTFAEDDEGGHAFRERLILLPFVWAPDASLAARASKGRRNYGEKRMVGSFYRLDQCVWDDAAKVRIPLPPPRHSSLQHTFTNGRSRVPLLSPRANR